VKDTHKLWAALIITGIIGGMVGIVLTEIMHTIQHLAYGYGSDGLYVSFREGVAQASPARRIVVVAFCGVVAGLGGWLHQIFQKACCSLVLHMQAAQNFVAALLRQEGVSLQKILAES